MGSTHSLLSPTMIAREALRLLKNNLVMGAQVYRAYEVEFPGSPKKGGTVTIRKPVKFKVTSGRTRATSIMTEDSITLSVDVQQHVSWSFNTKDLTLKIEEYSERYIRPAAAALANKIDNTLCGLYGDLYNTVYESTGYVNPHTFMVLGKAMQRMDEEAVPPDDRVIVFNPAAHWSMANALLSLTPERPAEQALRKGYIGRIANADIYMDQNIKTHYTGNWATSTGVQTDSRIAHATAVIAQCDTSQLGTTAVQLCDFGAVTTYFLRTGDVITFAGVYAVNPMSGESTGTLRQFTLRADVGKTSVSTAASVTASIYPNIIHTGPYKTVDTVPAAQAGVKIVGNSACEFPQNLAFHKNCFALVMVPLEKPDGTWGSTVTEEGYSIRVVKDYDINWDDEIIRLDVLYGVKTIYPELGVRVLGAQQ